MKCDNCETETLNALYKEGKILCPECRPKEEGGHPRIIHGRGCYAKPSN